MKHMTNNSHPSNYNISNTMIKLGTHKDLSFNTLCAINVVNISTFITIVQQINLTVGKVI